MTCWRLTVFVGFGLLHLYPTTTRADDTLPSQLLGRHSNLGDTWAGWGGSQFNDRWAPTAQVSSSNIQSLAVSCQVDYPSGVSAPATLHEGIAYYPTWNGSLVALNYSACEVKWQINVTDIIYGFNANLSLPQFIATNQVARTSPQIDPVERVLYFATQTWALLLAADLDTGEILGRTQVNPHPVAVVTISPTLHNGRLYIGASSDEEDVAAFLPGDYECCSFIGNAAAFTFDRAAGAFTTVWNTSTIPPNSPTGGGNGSWAGAGVWGSQPAIDEARRQVYYATGNLYTIPSAYYDCLNPETPSSASTCLPPDIYPEAVLALDMDTGEPHWARRLSALEAWTLVCGVPGALADNTTLCPQPNPGNDSDFGMAPAFVPAAHGRLTPDGKDAVAVGQKNGNVYALDADDGSLLWATLASPGSAGGGLSWGMAVDEARVYFTGINYLYLNWTLAPSNNVTVNSSGFGALSLEDGTRLWDVAAPEGQRSQVYPTVVGDLLLTGWTGPVGQAAGGGGLLALNKRSGETVFNYTLNAPFYGGIAVDGKHIMLGTGYSHGFGNGSFFVFTVDG